MNTWKIEATKYTPEISFDSECHKLELKGESYPENISEFSEILFGWLENYLVQQSDETLTVEIGLNYFNSSSSKMLLDLFDRLEQEVLQQHRKIVVNWVYDPDNEVTQEYGEEFKEDLEVLPFHLIPRPVHGNHQ